MLICDGCEKYCHDNDATCRPSQTKTEEEKLTEFVTANGEVWRKFKRVSYKCEKTSCWPLGIVPYACCEYTYWQEQNYDFVWKISQKTESGQEIQKERVSSVPCDCGDIYDALFRAQLAKYPQRRSEFSEALQNLCPGLSSEDANSAAQKCGLQWMWDAAFTPSPNDVINAGAGILGPAVKKGATPPPPASSSSPSIGGKGPK